MEKIHVMNLNTCWTIYTYGEGQVMNLNIGCIMLIEKFQVKIIRADNFRIVS